MNKQAATLLDQAPEAPLAAGADGVIRVAGTRVTLDTVAEAFAQGATAEEIAQQYPSLSLAEVYSTIGLMLRHEREVSKYLAERDLERTSVREANEQRFSPDGVRARLLARAQSQTRS